MHLEAAAAARLCLEYNNRTPGPTWNFVECSIGCNKHIHHRLPTGVTVSHTTHHTGWDAHHKDSLQKWDTHLMLSLPASGSLGQHKLLRKVAWSCEAAKAGLPWTRHTIGRVDRR